MYKKELDKEEETWGSKRIRQSKKGAKASSAPKGMWIGQDDGGQTISSDARGVQAGGHSGCIMYVRDAAGPRRGNAVRFHPGSSRINAAETANNEEKRVEKPKFAKQNHKTFAYRPFEESKLENLKIGDGSSKISFRYASQPRI